MWHQKSMVPSIMGLTIFFILVLTYTANAGLLPNIDPIESVQSAVDNAATGTKGAIGAIPEIFTDSFGQILDINNVPVVPRVPVIEMIKSEGYPSESYYVTTSDGYILNIHRIPHGKNDKSNGKVVYLQHGLLTASSDWVLFGPKHGLAYLLADEGYDVWMGNSRGNLYSRNHTRLSPDDKEFWQFSWHEIGIYDIPAIIDFVIEKTGIPQIYHIGHSQGTTTFYVMATEKPEYNNKIKAHVSLAPIAFMEHLFDPLIRIIALGTYPLDVVLKLVGEYELLPSSGFLNLLTEVLCSQSLGTVLCKNALFALFGFSPNQLNATNIPVILAHYPAGAATKQVIHYNQEILSHEFQQFDYGFLANYDRYKSYNPPNYDLTKITTNMYLIYGSNDWLAANVDVERLYDSLVTFKKLYNIPSQTWTHIDFIFGNDARPFVYDKVLEFLAE